MFLHNTSHEKRLRELLINSENMRDNIQNLFNGLGMTPEELKKFLNDATNFSRNSRETIKKIHLILDDKLQNSGT